jgi:hypothetical protein
MSKEVNLEELKAKYTTIYKLDIPTDEGEKVLYLRKLDRVTYSAGAKLMEKDELQAAEMFLRSLTVGGDDVEEIIKDFDSLRVASALLVEVIGTRTGNVARL